MHLYLPKKKEDISEAAVVIGTPLITGPAVITTTVILVNDIGIIIPLIAGTMALIVVLVMLLLASQISRLVGKSGMSVISTMMGIVTLARGVQYLLMGIAGA